MAVVFATFFVIPAIAVFFNPSILLIVTSVSASLYNTSMSVFMHGTSDLIYGIDSYESRINALMSYIDNIDYPYSTEFSFAFTTKLAACLAFLILIRGGVPRYRYDILTKLGWVKFLGFVLAVFIFTLVTFFLY